MFVDKHALALVPVDEDLVLMRDWLLSDNRSREDCVEAGGFAYNRNIHAFGRVCPSDSGGPRKFRYRLVVLRPHHILDLARGQTLSIINFETNKAEPYTIEGYEFMSTLDKARLPVVSHLRPPAEGPTRHDTEIDMNPFLVTLNAFHKINIFQSGLSEPQLRSLPSHIVTCFTLVADVVDTLYSGPPAMSEPNVPVQTKIKLGMDILFGGGEDLELDDSDNEGF
ncbi:hypothetical protein MNV49_006966 [Pseudohyphozyma bogoriensis]|nr:hypothetical protein MNV49_006966 [Pseudohyphozyma bogoriensis]